MGATARIEFGIARASEVTLAIYNVSGRVIRVVSEGPRGPGVHSVAWDGKDNLGRFVAAGLYLVKLTAGPEVHTQKVVIAR